MRYSEIIGLQDYFHPVFNLEDETINYWKQFIPNDQFYEVLRKTLSALDTNEPSLRKSIWIQGSYGTGKSHAASVVKHLLSDDYTDIEDYINENIEEPNLRTKIKNYRAQNRILPIVLKGVGSISNSRTFALQIEKAVRTSPSFKDLGIVPTSDFDRLIDMVNNPLIDWELLIKKYDELSIYVKTKDDILRKLNAYDIEFYHVIEFTLNKEGIHFSHLDISKWLGEVYNEVISQNKASGMIIFWDEFTSVMDSINSGIISQLQNISELAEKNNIFLYLISHRTPYQQQTATEDISKLNDRFHIIQYSMEPITTYHIIAATIRKLNFEEWRRLQKETFESSAEWDDLISFLTNNQSATAKSKMKSLFPIHPYTAYLSTFIARNIGSTNRSIFGFLYDKELGFLNFINRELNEERLLTADYLWDFFVNAFENVQEARFNQVLDKYRLNIGRIKELGENYSKVFKGILLLNLLYKVINVNTEEGHPVLPSTDNIAKIFYGCIPEQEIEGILNYIDEQGIITKTPMGDFLIEFSSLPINEIEEEKESLRIQFRDMVKVIKYAQMDEELEKQIFKDNLYRESEISLFSTNFVSEHILRNRLNKAFLKPYSLKCAVFLSLQFNDIFSIVPLIKKLVYDEEFKNVVFVIVEEPFAESNFEKFIDYLARKQVSDNHNYKEQSANYENYAKEIVKEWFSRIKNKYMQLIFREIEEKYLASKIGEVINRQYSPKIFSKGIDSIPGLYKNANIWKFQNALKAAEIFITVENRSELEEKTSSGTNVYLKYLIKDKIGEYIVDENLKLKDTSFNHPLNVIQNEIETKLLKVKQRTSFNIGEELIFLTKAPYGVYTNMPNMALLGFVLRKYIGELYFADLGRPIEKGEMKDLINNMFKYWQNGKYQNKLIVRFGSKEERELITILHELFVFEEGYYSITDTRWAILKFIKEKAKYPLWSLKYCPTGESIVEPIDALCRLIKNTRDNLDVKFFVEVLEKIRHYQFDLRLALNSENFRIGFLSFLRSIDIFKEDTFSEIMEYLHSHLQEEIGLWEEKDVKIKVYEWSSGRNGPQEPPTPPPPKPPPPGLVEVVISKIRNFNQGEQELINRLIKMIEENKNSAELLFLFARYFT